MSRNNAIYDDSKTYYENLNDGPFGDYANDIIYKNTGEPKYDFFGTKVYSPFGMSAGPLPRARFVEKVLHKGFDIVTFKSVRTDHYTCHSKPNVKPLDLNKLDPTKTDEPIFVKKGYDFPLTLANSFGVPSFAPEFWQPEIRESFRLLKKGQAMLVAFQGTDRGDGHEAFTDDHVQGIKLLKETGAKLIEINLSCPNEGSSELLCFDTKTTRKILEKIRASVDDVQLIVKIAYFIDKQELKKFVEQIGPLVEGITAINTIAAKVVGSDGRQNFPGGVARAKPGISGHAIKHAGLEMVTYLDTYRKELGLKYKIIGVGGVQSAKDFHEYRKAGADTVMSLTGAMWNPNLAAEIKASL